MRVADYIIDFIYKKGASYIFTLAGGGAMFLNDAVYCHKKIKYICNHHEQASAFAAEAYAKTNNKIGAVMVTSGPGSTNAITGLLEAWQNSIPCIFISSQAKRQQMVYFSTVKNIRQLGVQELNIIPIVKPLTKYAAEVETVESIRFHLEKAFFLAKSGRPGPVWLDIPPDIATAKVKANELIGFNNKKTSNKPLASSHDFASVLNMLKKSQKPLIIAGGGIRLSDSVAEFRELLHSLNVPVVVPDMGLDLLEFTHPCYIGTGGTKGQRAANIAMQNADLILVIGSRLAIPFTGHEYDRFAPNAKKIVIDIDKIEHKKKTIKIDFFIHSDAKYFIANLNKKVKNIKFKFRDNWLKKCIALKNKYTDLFPTWQSEKNKINMYEAFSKISDFSSQGDIFTFDAGVTAYVATQTLKIKKDQRAIIPGATLTMGYNLPAIIGIWAATPKSNIICITGDGSFQMNIHELQTVVHHKIPAKIFIINNQGYLAIRTTQKNFFSGRLIGEGIKSGVSFPDTEKIAKAYDIKFFKINKNQELNTIIPKVLRYKGTAICDIICPTWQDILTTSSKQLPDGRMVSLPLDEMSPFLPEDEMTEIKNSLS